MITKINQAVILAGGKGTRLGELTKRTPKPLLPVNQKPFLTYLLALLEKQGIQKVILLVGPFQSLFKETLSSFTSLDLEFIPEPEPAGTAGALSYAQSSLEDNFLFLNGDTYFNCDYNMLSSTIAIDRQTIASIGLRKIEDVSRYGSIEWDIPYITSFLEKGKKGEGYINAGVYRLKKEILSYISKVPSSIEVDIFPQLAHQHLLLGCPLQGEFIDIGVPEDYELAQDKAKYWIS